MFLFVTFGCSNCIEAEANLITRRSKYKSRRVLRGICRWRDRGLDQWMQKQAAAGTLAHKTPRSVLLDGCCRFPCARCSAPTLWRTSDEWALNTRIPGIIGRSGNNHKRRPSRRSRRSDATTMASHVFALKFNAGRPLNNFAERTARWMKRVANIAFRLG